MRRHLLLAPSPPLLFMGEEWAAAEPFLFFCDFEPELAAAVRADGRDASSRSFETARRRGGNAVPDPAAAETFERSRLDWVSSTGSRTPDGLLSIAGCSRCGASEIVPLIDGIVPGAATWHASADQALDRPLAAGDGRVLRRSTRNLAPMRSVGPHALPMTPARIVYSTP